MKEEQNLNDVWSVLVPLLVGGLVGAGIALLLAPKSGRELRGDIKDMASDTRDKIATTAEKGKEFYVESAAAVKHAIEAGKAAYVEAGKAVYVSEMEKHQKTV